MSTIHIEANKEDIAKIVLMPGDPYRAKYIAENYLENPRLINKLRGEFGYTGKYKGKDVTIFSSGMGIASMGIYSYELFNDYDVDVIIRIGTAGSYVEELKPYDLLVVTSSYSTTNYDEEAGIENEEIINSSFELNSVIESTANLKRIPVKTGRVHTSEAFYNEYNSYNEFTSKECLAVEMETYALLFNAKKFHKKATTILTITDNLITNEKITPQERETRLNDMITLALESIVKL